MVECPPHHNRYKLGHEGIPEGRVDGVRRVGVLHVESKFVGSCDLELPALAASSSACSRLRSFRSQESV